VKEEGITTYLPLLQVSNVQAKHLAQVRVKSSDSGKATSRRSLKSREGTYTLD